MRQIKKGSINISVDLYIIDSTTGQPELGVLFNTAGMDLEYRRDGALVVNITEVTLAALTTAHADGGFLEIGHGYYRLDVPDAAFAAGANKVTIQGTVTGMIVLPQTIQLVDFDPEDAADLGLTAITGHTPQTGDNFARLGAPAGASIAADLVVIDDFLDTEIAAILLDTGELQTDWANGGRLDLIIDAIKAVTDVLPDAGALTGIINSLPSALTKGTADSGTTTTMVDAARTEADTDYWKGMWIRFTSGNISGQTRYIAGFNFTTDTITFTPATTQAVGTNTYEILPQSAIDAALASVATEARLAELDAANLPADIDAILLDTGTTLDAKLNTINNFLDTEIADILLDTGTTLDSKINAIKAITDQMIFTVTNLLNVNTKAMNDSTEAADDMKTAAQTMVKGSAVTGTLSTIEMTTNLTISVAGQYNGGVLIFAKDTITAALRGQRTDITATTILNGKLGFTAITTAPVNGDTFIIV